MTDPVPLFSLCHVHLLNLLPLLVARHLLDRKHSALVGHLPSAGDAPRPDTLARGHRTLLPRVSARRGLSSPSRLLTLEPRALLQFSPLSF